MRFRTAALGLTALVALASPASADDPNAVTQRKVELAGVPVVGGNSDIGIGFGGIGAIGQVDPNVKPFVWRAEVGSFTAFRSGGIGLSDHYVLLTLPHAMPNKLRLDIRPSFTHEGTLLYSGLGNAPPPIPTENDSQKAFQYGRTHPTLVVRARVSLPQKGLYALLGMVYTMNWFQIPETTALSSDLQTNDPAIKRLLVGTNRHDVMLLESGAIYDTRNDELAPTSGQYHQLKLRISPRLGDALPYGYGQLDLTLRAYVTPIPKRLTLAGRAVADVLFGNVPFYELARFEDTPAIGGSLGVRGVLGHRYYGKVKAFANLETRSDLFDFRFLKKDLTVSAVTFFDFGRVWLDLTDPPPQDGRGLGLHWGAGGGLRLRAGKTFVLRADIAYSPDGRPWSGYFQANHVF